MNSIKLILFSIALGLAPLQLLVEQQLPTQFDNNRIILIPELISGKKLRFFTDTGGGWNAISKELHQQYNWPTITKVADGEEHTLSEMPKFKAEAEIPAAADLRRALVHRHRHREHEHGHVHHGHVDGDGFSRHRRPPHRQTIRGNRRWG